jgi:hypothetical protein
MSWRKCALSAFPQKRFRSSHSSEVEKGSEKPTKNFVPLSGKQFSKGGDL